MTHTQALVEGFVIIIAQQMQQARALVRLGEYCYERQPEIVTVQSGHFDRLIGVGGGPMTIIYADQWWKGSNRAKVEHVEILIARIKLRGNCTFLQSNW